MLSACSLSLSLSQSVPRNIVGSWVANSDHHDHNGDDGAVKPKLSMIWIIAKSISLIFAFFSAC